MATTLTGEVERVTFENEETSFRVIRVGRLESGASGRHAVSVVGTFQAVGPGTRVRITGDFVNDPRRGEQFRVDTLVPIEPSTLVGLERYLGSGLIKGIGPGLAKRIVERFGMDSLKVLDTDPERLGNVPGIGARRVDEIRRAWSEQRAVSSIMLLLQTHGASPALAARIYKRYGDRAAAVVQRSPYRLALEVHGIGFKTADRIAQSMGIAGDHPERAQAGVLHTLGELADQGHLLAPREALAERTAEMLEIDVGHVHAAIDALWASEPLPPYSPVSMYFLALSHAPPAFAIMSASSEPAPMEPMSRPPSASGPRTTPTAIGTTTAMVPGTIISLMAPAVAIATACAGSGSCDPSMMPGFSRNWRRTSFTIAMAARPTAPIVSAPKMNGIRAPMRRPIRTSGSVSTISVVPSASLR